MKISTELSLARIGNQGVLMKPTVVFQPDMLSRATVLLLRLAFSFYFMVMRESEISSQ
jgi:hypothetical protein